MGLLSEHLKNLLTDNRPELVGNIQINVLFWAELVKRHVLTDEVIESWKVCTFKSIRSPFRKGIGLNCR